MLHRARLTKLEKKLADKQSGHDQAVAKLEALRQEKAQSDAELAESTAN